jgi:hypothetical protein
MESERRAISNHKIGAPWGARSRPQNFEVASCRADESARLFPVAVSPAEAADVLGVRAEQIQEAIRAGDLSVYRLSVKKRVLIEDLVS